MDVGIGQLVVNQMQIVQVQLQTYIIQVKNLFTEEVGEEFRVLMEEVGDVFQIKNHVIMVKETMEQVVGQTLMVEVLEPLQFIYMEKDVVVLYGVVVIIANLDILMMVVPVEKIVVVPTKNGVHLCAIQDANLVMNLQVVVYANHMEVRE